MLKTIALAVVLTAAAATNAPAEAAATSATALPAIGSDGLTLPLTADQLDAEERKTYATLTPDSDDARQFLYTRGFLRYCKQVVDGALPAAQLPPLPKRANWKRSFLSADEATYILDVALERKLAGRIPPLPPVVPVDPALVAAHALPALDDAGRTLPLTADQLTADEKAAFASLEPDSAKAKQYLYVRGYLRYCRLVIAETIKPLQLPNLPARENWSREHLSKAEATDVLDVALGMKYVARTAKRPAQ